MDMKCCRAAFNSAREDRPERCFASTGQTGISGQLEKDDIDARDITRAMRVLCVPRHADNVDPKTGNSMFRHSGNPFADRSRRLVEWLADDVDERRAGMVHGPPQYRFQGAGFLNPPCLQAECLGN